MSFASVGVEKIPPQYCAGKVSEVTEPKISSTGNAYLTFRVEGVGSSPNSAFIMFFDPSWLERDFNPASLDERGKNEYGKLIANDSNYPFALPALRVLLGDAGYDLFSRKCHDRAQVTEESVQEDLVSTINEVGQETFGYTLVQKAEMYTEKAKDATGEEVDVKKWRNTKLFNIKDPKAKDNKYKRSGLFRLDDAAMKAVEKATNNPKYGINHITQEVIPF